MVGFLAKIRVLRNNGITCKILKDNKLINNDRVRASGGTIESSYTPPYIACIKCVIISGSG